jgi:redox-sensitive bicupin YhaK (pirin superfamily)
MIIRPGQGPARDPFQATVDPINGTTLIQHESGVEIMITQKGTVHLKDNQGVVIQTKPGAVLEIAAKSINFYSEEQPKFFRIEAQEVNEV